MILDYLDELKDDVYPQPVDKGHLEWSREVIDSWENEIRECRTILDVGCGEAFVQPFFTVFGAYYLGICLNKTDVSTAKLYRRNVILKDFHDLGGLPEFDFVFSRHSLEHSPAPLLTLMEWHTHCKKYLGLVLPNPEYFGWAGRNHYSVMNPDQASFMLDRAGFSVVRFDETQYELRYLCARISRPRPFYLDDTE